MAEIKIPAMGESVTEATVGQWRKNDGDKVAKDEVLVDLETDKVTQDIYCPEDGVLEIKVQSGLTVRVGDVIGAIQPAGASSAGSAKPASQGGALTMKPKTVTPVPPLPAQQPSQVRDASPAMASATAGVQPAGGGEAELRRGVISPLAVKVAADLGVDPYSVPGTGPLGRVMREDVEAFAKSHGVLGSAAPNQSAQGQSTQGQSTPGPAAPPAQAAQAGPPREPTLPSAAAGKAPPPKAPAPAGDRQVTREPMTKLRKTIAARLVEAQHTAAMLTTFNEVDMAPVQALRKKYKEAFEKKHNIGLGLSSFFVSATVSALRAFPMINAQIHTDAAGNSEIVQFRYVDMAVAVSTPKGLMVPVMRNADKLSFAEIELNIKELAEKCRTGKIGLDEMQGGTFTITNGGIFGSLLSTPILNPPQSAILGMHAIKERPVAVDGKVEIRPMMYLAVSYDHRIVDGAEAVRFLVHIKDRLESPERLLLDV